MADISMCRGENDQGMQCERREECHRFTATPDSIMQSYISPPLKVDEYGDQECAMFWEDTEYDK